ncbi:unnamed protein product [Didymodactylos carnosus]|uniref:Uncharacterized protein n=1 Tax=Didymodactylos carnosus TaxID=1234261 RepID=A0A816GS99_9BILA|nr:unnamed protein product [Didymodactylos carnosus]CAF4673549.1 unnamed protein product [Didymodactylos carnosus]
MGGEKGYVTPCITDWNTFIDQNDQMTIELTELDTALRAVPYRVQNDGKMSDGIVKTIKNDIDLLKTKLDALSRFATDLSQRTQET